MRLLLHIYRFYAFLLRNLPEGFLRAKSSFASFLIRRIFRYRQKVILENLRSAFPGLSEREYHRIHRLFVRNFSDVFHEIIRYSRLPANQLMQKVQFKNPEILQEITGSGRSVMVLAGHFGNWEVLGLSLPLMTGCKTFAAAKKQADPLFNDIIMDLRQRQGLDVLISQNLYRSLLKQSHHPFAVFLLADQSPAKHEVDRFLPFLGLDTPVITGHERIARAMGIPVVFAAMKRVTRGKYLVEFKLIADNPKALEEFELTKRYNAFLEEMIREQPESWLWSHRRWKHSRETG